MIKIYIAGPMTGITDFNFPAFHAAAKVLRAAGYVVVNPAEVCEEVGKTWDWYMRKDIPELVKCDTVCLLPAWETSRGARLEKHIAEALGMEVMHYDVARLTVDAPVINTHN